jgi:hypothetical protein
VVGSEYPVAEREGAFVQRPCGVEVALGLHDGREIVQAGCQQVVLGVGTVPEYRRGPLDQGLAAGQVALVPPDQSQVLDGIRGLRMAGAEHPL